MKTVIIVSKCIRVIKLKNSEIWFEFHFKGVCSGSVLRKVLLISSASALIEKNEEYLIYVRIISCIEGVLRGEIIKVKALDECWDRS